MNAKNTAKSLFKDAINKYRSNAILCPVDDMTFELLKARGMAPLGYLLSCLSVDQRLNVVGLSQISLSNAVLLTSDLSDSSGDIRIQKGIVTNILFEPVFRYKVSYIAKIYMLNDTVLFSSADTDGNQALYVNENEFWEQVSDVVERPESE